MSSSVLICKEIIQLTSKLIEIGLSIDQNFPSMKNIQGKKKSLTEISVENFSEASVALKNVHYTELYATLREKRAFNIMLVDGSLIQFRYLLQDETLIKHLLCFFPSPNLFSFENDPEIFEDDVLYADCIVKNIVTTPIRFDYDIENSLEVMHPASHCTIGQYKNCRIPVRGGVTPYRFLNFILSAFYNTSYNKYCRGWKSIALDFPYTATEKEMLDLHFSFLSK